MKASTDKKLNALQIDMQFFYKWFYSCTVIALILGILFDYDFYYIGIAILFASVGRLIQTFANKLHEIRRDDQTINK